MELPEKLQFLSSTRFYVMLFGALAVYANAKGWIGEAERNLIATISALFVGVQTLDKAAKNIGGVKPAVTDKEP